MRKIVCKIFPVYTTRRHLKFNKLVKRSITASDSSVKKFDIRGVVFSPGPQPYIWYVEVLVKTVPRRKCPWGATKET
jgi:hypothetical protein